MANVNISDLNAATALDGTEMVETYQGATNVRTTVRSLVEAARSASILTTFMQPANAQTNWVTFTRASTLFLNSALQSSGAQNDYVEWDVPLPVGTYTLALFFGAGNNRGIFTVSVDGTSVGTIDAYAGSTGGADETIAAINLPSGGSLVRFTMATKNESSSSYFGLISAFVFTRTGEPT